MEAYNAPVHVFVGCAANGEDAESQAVLEYTLRKHSSLPVDIVWMRQSHDPASFWFCDYGEGRGGFDTSRWATPFSGFRWAIPAHQGYAGRAIYMDSDVIVQADVAELWRAPMAPGKCVVAKGKGSWRFCVSLWDCTRAGEHLPPLAELKRPKAHKEMGLRFKAAPWVQPFAPGQNWNCLDGEDRPLDHPSTKAIHYTSMANQPHLPHALERLEASGRRHWFNGTVQRHWRQDLIDLFDCLLREAEAAGYPVERYEPPEDFGPYRKADLSHYRGGPRRS